jgi:hypothetical protein
MNIQDLETKYKELGAEIERLQQQRDDDAEALLEMSRQRIAEYRREGRFVTRISDDEDYRQMVREEIK